MTKLEALVDYLHREIDGEFFIDVLVDRRAQARLESFATPAERDEAYEDLTGMLRELGAFDLPARPSRSAARPRLAEDAPFGLCNCST